MPLILDLCGGSGAWSAPYRNAGYETINITLPDYDVRTYTPPKNVYGILAAPPCTEFSLALQSRPHNFRKGLEIVQACLRIIWECRLNGELKFWAMENPRGFLRQFMGKPALTFKGWEYGDDQSKPTDLWGHFNPPEKIFAAPQTELISIQNMHGSARRAITPPHFAEAFFKANK